MKKVVNKFVTNDFNVASLLRRLLFVMVWLIRIILAREFFFLKNRLKHTFSHAI